ncbi:hypothetical protein PINS_up003450 [Pythium insidiosum]|nr:hypothetical protein PINS_up003450 [Pythium insidiosum]
MRREYQPTSFVFRVQPEILCVGMSIVYRVSLAVTTTATCSPPSITSSRDHHSSRCWAIALSESKLVSFYAQLSGLLAHDSLQRLPENGGVTTTWLLSYVRSILLRHFQIRRVFEIHNDFVMVNEDKMRLEAFVHDCWRALEIILPSLAIEPRSQDAPNQTLVCLYILLRDFLAFPESILEANWVFAHAVLGLRDVHFSSEVPGERDCCICLEDLAAKTSEPNEHTSQATWELESSRSRTPDECMVDADDGESFSVSLPCGHVFHENCIMAWLRCNPSCPECRAFAVPSQEVRDQ